MAHNVVAADWSDPQIVKYQKRAFSRIKVITKRFADPAFDSDEHEYEHAVYTETILAALYLLQHELGGSAGEIPAFIELRNDAKDAMAELAENTGVGAEGSISSTDVDLIPLQDWGRNAAVAVPNKLKKTYLVDGILTGHTEGKGEFE
jgi:hypothetical protein